MKNCFIKVAATLLLCLSMGVVHAESGRELWLRFETAKAVQIETAAKSKTVDIACEAIKKHWNGRDNAVVRLLKKKDKQIKGDGFILSTDMVQANSDLGLLYGVYEMLRMQQLNGVVKPGVFNPDFENRILNHWDNLDGTIERGYSGHSIFWRDDQVYDNISEKDIQLWKDYAQANASIGINGTVLNNVNAKPEALTLPVLNRVKAINEVMRPYGIKVYMCINFSSPAELGGLKDSDPLNPEVKLWWKNKVKEIYQMIPDFGGFLVKANSEGLPGPQDYGRTHADGANMLADVLKPYNGIVMWRAFVYASNSPDRAKQAYDEFLHLDGQFRDNVLVQIKNGPIDFQPREPFSPLFGAMKKTSIMPELQITQEYLGHSFQLVYLAPMWEEFLKSDTYQYGPGSTVARCSDGSLSKRPISAIAGVANIGLDENWCGHTFAQSNWYAFGRLAWNHEMSAKDIADEWVKLTFMRSQKDVRDTEWNGQFFIPIKQMMLDSWEACIEYSMPLGLHHIFAGVHHYGPGPWYAPEGMRVDWTPPYYHKADKEGLGFNRTKSGSNAVSQYAQPLADRFENLETCPENLILFFHHVPWDYKMKSGKTFWDELCYTYDRGVRKVREFQKVWDKTQMYVDAERFDSVQSRLRRHYRDAQIWKDGCLLYFQQFSKRPIPYELERPVHDLKDVQAIDLGWEHHN